MTERRERLGEGKKEGERGGQDVCMYAYVCVEEGEGGWVVAGKERPWQVKSGEII